MALHPSEGVEPIPGYRLVQRLGSGGYGEVWKATAPGGLTKAIKIVYGHMQDIRAEQELKALSRIRDVRHPFLLSLERFEIVEGQLIVVTELADMSLTDRYEVCRAEGLNGIPRAELLVYMRDAADALDYMADQFGLQHLDIKPPNLLLVGGRIKVADFGLVKNLQGSSVTATGGVTPIYASPEAFDGRVSKFSDQYSLAIVYQEMLTGVRPFPGTTPLQLAMQHTHSPPFLDPLPGPDRAVIARALAKAPGQRFPTCRELAEQLLSVRAPSAHRAVRPAPPQIIPPSPSHSDAAPVAAPASESLALPTSVASPPAAQDATAVASAAQPRPTPELEEPEDAFPLETWSATDSTSFGAVGGPGRGLRPTLFVGLGGLACAALRRLRRRLQDRFGTLSAVPILRTLLVDTDRSTFRQVQARSGAEALDAADMLVTPLRKPEQYRPQSRELLRWLDRRWLYGIPRSLQTEGMRPLGRLALLDNANELLTRLRVLLREITEPEAIHAAQAATGLGLWEETPRVFLVASISGATGGGMLVDAAYALRQVLHELHLPSDAVHGVLLHATSQKPTGKELARVNACATLIELNHFCQPRVAYPGDLRYGLKAARPGESPFPEGWVLHLGDDLDEASADVSTDHVAEFLYLNAVTAGGALFEDQAPPLAPGATADLSLRTFGMARITLPRYLLADQAGNLFCRHLVTRWRGEFNTPADEHNELEQFRTSAAAGLEVDAVASHFWTAAGTVWREEPEAYLRKILEEAFWGQKSQRGDPQLREVCNQALREITRLLGAGCLSADSEPPTRTAFEVALHDHAGELGQQLGRSIVEWLVGLIENPQRRLIKAADQAARWFVQHLLATCETLVADLGKLRTHREAVRARLAAGDLPAPEPSGNRWFGLRAKQETLDPQPHFLDYCLLRLREIALENTLDVLGCVQGQVTAFTQDVARSLEKMRHFAELFSTEVPSAPSAGLTETPPPPGSSVPQAPVPNVKELLPEGAKTSARAAESLFHRIGPQITTDFEESLQVEVLNPLGGLWSIVSGPRDLKDVLLEVLRKRARAAMLTALQETDAAKLYLTAQEDPVHLAADLRAEIDAAGPRLTVPPAQLCLVALLPTGDAGTVLREIIQEIVPPPRRAFVASEGDVILCQASQPLSAAAVAGAVIGNRPTYVEAAHKVLTRTDINWTSLRPSESPSAAAAR